MAVKNDHTWHGTLQSLQEVGGLLHKNLKITRKPLVHFPYTTLTVRPLLHQSLNHAQLIRPIITRFRSKDRFRNLLTIILTLTHCPENLDRRPRIDGKGGVEVDIGDTGLASGGCFNPGFAYTEDVRSVARAINEGFADRAARFAAGVRRRRPTNEMGVFPGWKAGEGEGQSRVKEASE
jgi:hypothetical protein